MPQLDLKANFHQLLPHDQILFQTRIIPVSILDDFAQFLLKRAFAVGDLGGRGQVDFVPFVVIVFPFELYLGAGGQGVSG